MQHQQQKNLFTFISSRCAADTLQNLHCFHAWLCVLEAHPRRSYKLTVAFFPHHWSRRNKTYYSVWKPPHQTEIPHASLCIYLHMNHLVSNKTFLVSGIRFAYLHFTWGLRLWKAICRAESTQLFPMIQLYTMELSPGECQLTCMAHHTPSSWGGLTVAQPLWHPGHGARPTQPNKCSVQKPGSRVKLCRVKGHPALLMERHFAIPTGTPSSATRPTSPEGDPCPSEPLVAAAEPFPPEGS